MQTLPEHSYIDAANRQRFVATSDVNLTGTWADNALYVGDVDVVVWGTGTALYIATQTNTANPPFAGPWSFLAQFTGTTPPAPLPAPSSVVLEVSKSTGTDSTARATANQALAIAIIGTDSATAAQATADIAMSIAIIGTDSSAAALAVAEEALGLAIIGTNASTGTGPLNVTHINGLDADPANGDSTDPDLYLDAGRSTSTEGPAGSVVITSGKTYAGQDGDIVINPNPSGTDNPGGAIQLNGPTTAQSITIGDAINPAVITCLNVTGNFPPNSDSITYAGVFVFSGDIMTPNLTVTSGRLILASVNVFGGVDNPPPELGQPNGSLYLSSGTNGTMFFRQYGTWAVK